MAFRLSAKAQAEADKLWLYIARESGSMNVADAFIDSLEQRFCLLAANPQIGRRRDEDLRPGIRSFPVGKYLILYRIEGRNVLILHVIQGSRDIQAFFKPQRGHDT